MKQYVTHETGSAQTLSEVQNTNVVVYDTKADAEADLSNLSEGQIVATKDSGDELAQPVDTVASGNMHAVTSNAVSRAFILSMNKTTIGEVLDELGITEELYPYVRLAFTNLVSAIGGYSTGVITVDTGGPQFGFVLYKLNDNYYNAELLSYDSNFGLPIIRITHNDGLYFSGVKYTPFI